MTDRDQLPPFAVRTPLAGTPPTSTVMNSGAPGVILRERHAGRVVVIAAFRDRAAEVRRRIATAVGIEPPAAPGTMAAQDVRIVWSGPGRWLVLANGAGAGQRMSAIEAAVDGIAAASEQSSALLLVQISGPEVRAGLAKVLLLDLHPTSFPVGAAAMTALGHVAVHVWRAADRDGNPVFEIAAPRSYAASVWHELVEAGVAHGLDAVAL